jgi:hypothetical protein
MIAYTSAVKPVVESTAPVTSNAPGTRVLALGDELDAEQQRRGRDRDVDEEHGGPVEPLQQHAAGERAEPDPERGERGPDADRLAALLLREHVGDDRQRRGHDQRRTDAHQRADGDDLTGRVGDQRAEAREAEDGDAGLQRQLAAVAVAERAEHQQQAGEHQQVGVDHPLQRRGGRLEVRLQRGERDVEDRVVEPDDHEAQRQDAERLPAHRVGGGVHGGTSVFHRWLKRTVARVRAHFNHC